MIQLELLTKRYYTIGEVAKMFDVAASLIRYWESEFNSLKPHKNNKGDRRYTSKDIEQLDRIYILVKEKGYTLDGAKKEITHLKMVNSKKRQIITKLKSIQKELKSIRTKLS